MGANWPHADPTEGEDLIRTDYLVVGSGTSGLAFADALVEDEPDVE